jgi:serralysin
VAWKIPGADQYTVWNTDSSGNYLSNPIGVVSGSSAALKSLEASFHQDLNGDGLIDVPTGSTTTIESFGSTSLVQVGNNYDLDSVGGASGPSLKYGGAAVVAGQFAPFAPIGVEQTAGGYEIAWKIPGADQYTVWNTDNNGNYISNAIGVVSGSSNALQSLEPSFQQDLNGDGVIGAPAPQTTPPASLAAAGMFASGDKFVFGSSVAVAPTDFSEPSFSGDPHGMSQTQLQSPHDGHDTVIDLGSHDSVAATNIHLADLHMNDFMIR